MINRALVFYVVLTTGCTPDERPGAQQDLTPPSFKNGTQKDLAKEIEEAHGRRTWSEVRHRWQGQWLRWNVIVHESLCRSEEACNVAAFPVQRPAKVGWMPQLVFAPGQYTRMRQQCGKRAQCEISIEGLLERLDVSAEMPTNVKLGNVKIAAL